MNKDNAGSSHIIGLQFYMVQTFCDYVTCKMNQFMYTFETKEKDKLSKICIRFKHI